MLHRARLALLASEKTCQRKVFQKHLDGSTWGKSPSAVGDNPAPGCTVAPTTPAGQPPTLGAAEMEGARRTGSPQPLPPAPEPGRAVPASQGGGGGARHPLGAEGADSLAPCLENGPFKLAAKAPNVGRGIQGQRGVPSPGSSCVGGKAHLQLPPAPEQPLFPYPAEELLELSWLFVRGDLFPLSHARTVTFLARISCQKTIPLSKSRPRK